MSTNAIYMADEIGKKLRGATIGNPVITPDEDYSQMFGFEVTTAKGEKLHVWVQQDAEGNGPGWLNIEKSD